MTSDTAIVEGLRLNDSDATRLMVETHGRRLLHSAILLCGNEPDAQDAVQETLITALKVIGRFRGTSALHTWLHGILINVVRHLIRERKPTVPLDEALEHADARSRTPAQAAARADDCAYVRSVVAALPEEHREVVVLRYFEDMKIEEIAQQLGLQIGTVKSRLHYAAKKLRASFSRELSTL